MGSKIAIAVTVVVIAFIALLLWSYSGTIASITVDEKVVALSYDDGPNPPHTRAMLDALDKHGVKATFFLKGRNAEAFPDAVREIAAAGHEIGNHSYYHRAMTTASQDDMLEEVLRTNQILKNILGFEPVLFRPPYGAQGPGLKLALNALGMTSILMNAHGTDWEEADPALIASAILTSIEPGSIVLLHDGHGDVDDPLGQDSRAATVAATEIIIESLHAQGYRIVPVGELMALGNK